MQPEKKLAALCGAEVVGTFLLVFFGCGAVHTAVLMDAQSGLWQVAIVWAIAIMLAIYTCGAISGAHINPAITLGLSAWRLFPRRLVLPYIGAQLVGAFLAAAALYGMFGAQLAQKEADKQVTRGEPASVITAMCYGEYYPNPGGLAAGSDPLEPAAYDALMAGANATVACGAEFLGTLILALVVVAVTDKENPLAPGAQLAPVFIGLTVAALISVIAPLTQACFNPARDFGPRLFASLAGWGGAALPGPNGLGILGVYLLAPIAGAISGVGCYQRFIKPNL